MRRRAFVMYLAAATVGAVSTLSGLSHAVRGRPATPASVGGVRRRTRRRTRRRVRRRVVIGMTITALPASCTVVVTGGINYHFCGGVYYRPTYQGTTVVYVVEKMDPDAEEYVEFEEEVDE